MPARVQLRRPEPGEGNLLIGFLMYGANERDGVVHYELHRVFCSCAFHPMPEPHWHPCSEGLRGCVAAQRPAASSGGPPWAP